MIAVGIDAAFANMGFARVRLDPNPDGKRVRVACLDLKLVSTQADGHKTVRKSSEELRRAKELNAALVAYCAGASFAFVEVPSGSQSASAARALGIAVGVLSCCPIPIIEVSPMEVKVAVSGNRKTKANKADIIKWAVRHWPGAPWLRDRGKIDGRIINDNEHLADAMATVMAGIATPEFQRLLAMVSHATPSTSSLGPSSSRRRLL